MLPVTTVVVVNTGLMNDRLHVDYMSVKMASSDVGNIRVQPEAMHLTMRLSSHPPFFLFINRVSQLA